MGLPIKNLHGQDYDNGSSIKAKENCVQKRILNIDPRTTLYLIPL